MWESTVIEEPAKSGVMYIVKGNHQALFDFAFHYICSLIYVIVTFAKIFLLVNRIAIYQYWKINA